ncbi:hypothetical protein BKA70DRAFT_1507190, partial [Coprinopsis sp. MPI-PUGE-AT-0042]
LVSSGIPCSIWECDPADLLFGEAKARLEQDIIVPDNTPAGCIFKPTDLDYLRRLEKCKLAHPYPDSLGFELPETGNSEGMAPKTVKIHPQSYFANFDLVNELENPRRFIPLPSYLDNRILVPDLHTLLEGLVHCLIHPPAG